MSTPKRFGIVLFVLAMIASMLACSLGGAAQATSTPKPPPATKTPRPESPTETPVPVVIPSNTPETIVISSPVPPEGDDLTVTAISFAKDEFDDWNVYGLVTNYSKRTVDNVEVTYELFDASGASLYKETIGTDIWVIAPGESAPFSSWVADDIADVASATAEISGQSSSDVVRADVSMDGVQVITDDYGDIHLTGKMVNNGSSPAYISDIAGALFDTSGQLVTAYSYGYYLSYLDPGETGPFRVTISVPDALADQVDTYELYLDAQETTQAEIYDIEISQDNSDYIDKYGSIHLVGSVTNNSSEFLSISLVGSLYDADDNVLDVATSSMPFYSIAPGETIPFEFSSSWGVINYTEGMYADTADNYLIQVDYYWTSPAYYEPFDLATDDANDVYEMDDYQITFTGQVVNDSGGAAKNVTIAVALVDPTTGAVVATGYSYIYDEIADGGTTDYEVYIPFWEGFNFDDYEVYYIVKGER